MCDFLYVFVPPSADLVGVRGSLESNGLGYQRTDFSFPWLPLPAGTVQILATLGHCSCGTAIGGRYRKLVEPPGDRELAILKKKGWTDARIRRWMVDKSSAAEARNTKSKQIDQTELDQWLGALKGAVGSGSTTCIGLVCHFAGSRIERPDGTSEPMRQVRSGSLTSEDLVSLPRDTVLLVVK